MGPGVSGREREREREVCYSISSMGIKLVGLFFSI